MSRKDSSCFYHLESNDMDIMGIINHWTANKQKKKQDQSCLYHLDITPADVVSKDDLLFHLAILRGLIDTKGSPWVLSARDMYTVEMTESSEVKDQGGRFYRLLPTIQCLGPSETLDMIGETNCNERGIVCKGQKIVHLMSLKLFQHEVLQRPYQYHSLYNKQSKLLEDFSYSKGKNKGLGSSSKECLVLLLK